MNLLHLLTALAAPPVDTPEAARPIRHWDIEHLDLHLTLDPANPEIAGRATYTLRPHGLSSDTIRLHQVGLSFGEVTVDGAVVQPRIGLGTIDLPAAADKPHTITLAWTARPETGLHRRSGRAANGDSPRGVLELFSQGENEDNRHWLPAWDHPSDRFSVATTLTVPTGLHAVANGRLLSTTPNGGTTTWSYRMDHDLVTYLLAVAVGRYDEVSGGPDVAYLVPPGTPSEDVTRSLGDTPAMLRFFGEQLAQPYAYGPYRQVIAQRFLYGGMENTTLTILADTALAGSQDLDAHEAWRVVAHEAAHHWFGDLLTCHGWRELWLNEGFATFYAALWEQHTSGPEAYAARVLAWHHAARATRTPLGARAWSTPTEPAYTAVYTRGPSVLHQLRSWLGAARFDAAIRAYVADNAHQLVEADDLREALEAQAGMSLHFLFDRYVHGTGAPKISTKHAWKADQVTVTIDLTDEVVGFQPPTLVRWADASGAVHEERLWLSAGRTRLVGPSPGGVQWLVVDPEASLIATWERDQDEAGWLATLATAPDATARLIAVDALGQSKAASPKVAEVLGATLHGGNRLSVPDSHDTHPFARAAAAALGKLATPEARAVLLPAASDAALPPLVRLAAIEALSTFTLDPSVADTLAAEAQRAPYPAQRGAALSALAEVQPSRALPAALAVLRGPDGSAEGRAHSAALHVVGNLGAVGDLPAVLRFTQADRRDVQHAAGQSAVKLTAAADPPARRRVTDALLPWLTHTDLRTRQQAVGLLGRHGDPAASGALRALSHSTRLPALADAANAALTAIAGRTPGPTTPDAVKKLEELLEQLQKKLDTLTERMDAADHG